MKKRKKLGLGAVTGAALFGLTPAAPGATITNLGTLGTFNGPGQLDLTGNFPYAIDFNDTQNRTVNGVTFLTDQGAIPGATLSGPQNVVNWQTAPTFGATADDTALQEIMSDIRWANTSLNEFLQADLAVTPGQAYKLQVLFNGNQSEDRRWDILIEDALAVDGVTSLGPQGSTYASNTGIVYTYPFTAADNTFSVVFDGRNGPGTGNVNGGADVNPIWQAMTLEIVAVPEPSSCTLLALSSLVFVRRLRKRGAF